MMRQRRQTICRRPTSPSPSAAVASTTIRGTRIRRIGGSAGRPRRTVRAC